MSTRESSQPVPITALRVSQAKKSLDRLQENVATVIRGKDSVIELAILAFCARGHLLIEDIPGVGKTTLARAMARSIDGTFRRIQFTSDLLPSDVIGVSVYHAGAAEFQFKPGPLFANIVLADEINRATPKTQSALLEAMNEHQVSYDTHTYRLPAPFMVLATQNPFDHHGTFPLPESQLDRFFLRIEMGYPPEDDEKTILRSGDSFDLVDGLRPVLSTEDAILIQEEVRKIRVDAALVDYIFRIVNASRDPRRARLGASPRAGQVLYRAGQASALLCGRDHCRPDDIKRVAVAVLAHRIIPTGSTVSAGEGREAATAVIEGILESVEVPV